MGFLKTYITKPVLAASVLVMSLAVLSSVQISSAEATSRVSGTLRCQVLDGFSFVFGSTRDLRCIYTPKKGPEQFYRGTINKYGVDLGYLRSSKMIWRVYAPITRTEPGILEGHYVGATAELTAGAGLGANALASTNKIMLNPISVSGTTGLNIAGGIADLKLEYLSEER